MVKNISEVLRLAEAFRRANEITDRSTLPISFQEFPAGSCGDSTVLLGTYFIEVGLGEFDYVGGVRGSWTDNSWTSHAWLNKDGLIVDITADQFGESMPRVYVGYGSYWHDSFKFESKHVADFHIYDKQVMTELEQAYRIIRANIVDAL